MVNDGIITSYLDFKTCEQEFEESQTSQQSWSGNDTGESK